MTTVEATTSQLTLQSQPFVANYNPISPFSPSPRSPSPSPSPSSSSSPSAPINGQNDDKLELIQSLEQRPDVLKLSDFMTNNSFNAIQNKLQNIEESPAIIVDLDMVERNYDLLQSYFPYGTIYFAVKANPAIDITKLLVNKGSSFDVASIYELDKVLSAGLSPERVSYGNTIKKARDIGYFYNKGVRLFVTDSEQDLVNISLHAPNSRVYVRILLEDGESTAEWPLSRKFGCVPEMAKDLLIRAKKLNLIPAGISFHVGSQQTDPHCWGRALQIVSNLFIDLYDNYNIHCDLVNLGGGLCSNYCIAPQSMEVYSKLITQSIETIFPQHLKPKTIIFEPGRSLVGNTGILCTEVAMIASKSPNGDDRWCYLDAGIFNGVIEALGEALKYPFLVQQQDTGAMALCSFNHVQGEYERAVMEYLSAAAAATAITTATTQIPISQYHFSTQERIPFIIAGPTCDSADILYQKTKYLLPKDIKQGDKIWLLSTGAYTQSYSAVEFNGFKTIQCHCISSNAFLADNNKTQ
jgi:ornithine decarboxylase